MTRFLLTLCISVAALSSTAQTKKISHSDSVKLSGVLTKVFRNFSSPNYKQFSTVSMEGIHCLICEDKDFRPIKRQEFFSRYLREISAQVRWMRAAASTQRTLLLENRPHSDISVLITTLEKDELRQGHEGAQLAIHFKRSGDSFKFSGLESIP